MQRKVFSGETIKAKNGRIWKRSFEQTPAAVGNTAQSVAARCLCADVIAARFLKKVSNFRSAGDMKEILKAANFKGFAVSETPRKALRCETCGAPRSGNQSGLPAGKLPAGVGFSFQAFFAVLFLPAEKGGLLFSAGMIFCFAGCARARGSIFCFMLWDGHAAE